MKNKEVEAISEAPSLDLQACLVPGSAQRQRRAWGPAASALAALGAPRGCAGREGVNLTSSSFNMRSPAWHTVAIY